MRAKSSHWTILVVACSFVSACGQNPTAYSHLADQKTTITFKSIEIVKQDLPLSRFEEWKDTGKSKLPVFDVLMRLENNGPSAVQDADFIVLTTMEFVIAPTYLHQGDAKKILQNGHWSRLISADDVKMGIVPYVKSGDVVELRIRDFNLKNVLEEYNGQDHTLWPWGLRINLHIMDRDMSRVAFAQATLRLVPSDKRLPAK
jgi:hypothetical protein